ncbi:MAG TPA: hypothetical protein VNL16_11660 [Chloroflexota bacterium]|nr:hypothetical protein [Chloroflexota bacterium]
MAASHQERAAQDDVAPRLSPIFLSVLFLAVVLPGAAVALLGRFDGLYGQDAFAYDSYALGPLRQSLLHLAAPPPFYWPPGFPLLMALLSFVLGPHALAGQVVSMIAGGLVPVFTALLAAEIWPSLKPSTVRVSANASRFPAWFGPALRFNAMPAVPLLAGAAAAFNGQLWQSSIVVMADTTGLALATAGAWALARYARTGKVAWLVLAGAALAGAVTTRWAYALVAIPCAAYALLLLSRSNRHRAWLHAAPAILVVAAILGPTLVPTFHGLLFGNRPAPFSADLQVYTWNPLNALRRDFVTADGRLTYRLPNGLYYALAPARTYFFTPLLAWLLVPGLWSVARRPTAGPLFLIVGWAAVVYGFHAGAAWQNFRFTLAYLPPAAILVAIGTATIADLARRSTASRVLRSVFAVSFAAGLVWMAQSGFSLSQGFVERKDADLATVAWIRTELPPDALLFTFGLTLTVRHYTSLETVDLSEVNPSDLARLISGRRPAFVLVDVDNVESQWRGRPPSQNFQWLHDGPGLVRIGQRETYTLLEIHDPTSSDTGPVTRSPPRQVTR